MGDACAAPGGAASAAAAAGMQAWGAERRKDCVLMRCAGRLRDWEGMTRRRERGVAWRKHVDEAPATAMSMTVRALASGDEGAGNWWQERRRLEEGALVMEAGIQMDIAAREQWRSTYQFPRGRNRKTELKLRAAECVSRY